MTPKRTLLLAAHGSSHQGADNPVLLHAERIRKEGTFTDVRCGFLKEAPLLPDVLAQVQTPELVVVPMLAGHGHTTDDLIPQALACVADTISVHLCEPLGAHQAIPGIMAERARSVMAAENLPQNNASVLVASHGNPNIPQIANQSRALAASIETLMGGAPTIAAFIEEAPLISNWTETTSSENLIVLPFLIGGGLHEAQDIPAMLGVKGASAALDELADGAPFVGPLRAHGRIVWLCRTLGNETALSDVILDLAGKR